MLFKTAMLAAALAAMTTPVALAQDFGDDSGQWALDGECDDPRFEGPGMTDTPLLDEDRMADATDCKTAFDAGLISLISSKPGMIDFGDDSGDWALDGECDDPRFAGPGMTDTPLLDADRFADATDCKTAFDAGLISLAPEKQTSVDFGDDSSEWALDGECDDPRFVGNGMTDTPLLDEDRFADATDCRLAYEAGAIRLR